MLGQWGYEVALAVFAYRAGGAAAVGVVALIRLLPAAIVAPFAALLGDRFRRRRLMVAADLVRVCASCKVCRRCARDLVRGDVQAGMWDYCLNGPTLDTLTAGLDGRAVH